MMKNEHLLEEIAKERIFKLVELAKSRTIKMGSTDELAKRYINIAKDMKSHYRIRSANSINKMLCRTCNSVIVPGMNARVRVPSQKGYRAIICSRCGTEKHLFYE
jgi:RNase P subunit RPR2